MTELVVVEPRAVASLHGVARSETIAGAFLAEYVGHTRDAYRRDLRDFFAWCAAHDLDPLAAGRPHIQLYLRVLEAAGRAKATVARRASAVAGLFRYAADEGFIDRNPIGHMRRPRVPEDSPTLGLSKDEALALLDHAETAGTLEHALICLLALNGLRVSEVCSATITDLDTQRGHRTLSVVRKGGKRATVPLAPRTAAAIADHTATRDLGPLLVRPDGTSLDRHAAARIVARVAATVTDKRISPHSLRHTFVTLALDAGVPLRDVQDAAGHADPRTTRRYDRARESLDRHATYTLAAFIA